MSLRTKLLLIFGGIVVIAVALVSFAVSAGAGRAFQRLDEQRTAALVGQFRREFQLQGESLAVRAAAITNSPAVREMAISLSRPSADPAPYLNLAPTLASEQQLDFLEILEQDGTIISSAQWPARFGLRESWPTSVADWNHQSAFLRYEETPQGSQLALLSVRQFSGLDHGFYLVAGRKIDSNFLRTLVPPEGTRLLLWQQPPDAASGQLEDSSGAIDTSSDLSARLGNIGKSGEMTTTLRLNHSADPLIAHTLPLAGRDPSHVLATLIVASSRRELTGLQNNIRNIGALIALVGIAFSILASGWWATRISRPISELSDAAQDVTGGNWDRKVYLDESLRENDEVAVLIGSFNRMTEELERQRDRAVQAERVAAWRELARRLAHELNNPLFPLQITVENLVKARQQDSLEFGEIFAESTATLQAELRNLKAIVVRFSDFSKMPTPQLRRVDLNQLVSETARLFAPQLAARSEAIKLETVLTSADARVGADPDLLRRAFENLVLNAIDAMPNGGQLTIRTIAQSASVVVEVCDTGTGLTPEECSRLFTPYYTTKQHGTGLGLAIVQAVVSDHGARISVSSRPNVGTTFRMEFQRHPAIRDIVDAGAPARAFMRSQ